MRIKFGQIAENTYFCAWNEWHIAAKRKQNSEYA